MCGIIAGYVEKPKVAKEMVQKIFNDQKSRGIKGFGLGIRKQDGTLLRDRTCTEKEIFDSWLWQLLDVKDYFVFHHRLPTSTFNTPECNHPIMNEDESMMVIHNGIITTCPLDDQHEFETEVISMQTTRKRIVAHQSAFTDTEIAVHYLEETLLRYRQGWKHAMYETGEAFTSTFVFLAADYDGLLFSARSNPLYAYKIGRNTYLSSQRGVLQNMTAAKDLEPGFGSMIGGVIHHEKPSNWSGRYSHCGSQYPAQYGSNTNFGKSHKGTTMWDGYLKEAAEERSGNKEAEATVSKAPDCEERAIQLPATIRVVPDGTKPPGVHGSDWPGHVNYIWPETAVGDLGNDEMLILVKENDICQRMFLMGEILGSELDDEDEEWMSRCELADTFMTRVEHSTMFPNCDDECTTCISRACPYHIDHSRSGWGGTQRRLSRVELMQGAADKWEEEEEEWKARWAGGTV